MSQQHLQQKQYSQFHPWSFMLLGFYHEHAILLIFFVSFIPIFILWKTRSNQLPDLVQLLLVLLCVVLISGSGRHYIFAPFTRFLKFKFAKSAKVLFFRSFHPKHSHQARDNLAPILGCMGKLTTVHNKEYIQGLTAVEGHDQSDDSWFAWLELGEILSDGLETPKFKDSEWKNGVLELLQNMDLVVIDITGNSPNVSWELRSAKKALPQERIILLHDAEVDTLPSSKDIEIIPYSTSRKGRSALRKALYRRLKEISRG